MKILLTGATGFVGSHLAKDLCRSTDYRVSIVIREKSRTDVLEDALQKIKIYRLSADCGNIYDILRDHISLFQ